MSKGDLGMIEDRVMFGCIRWCYAAHCVRELFDHEKGYGGSTETCSSIGCNGCLRKDLPYIHRFRFGSQFVALVTGSSAYSGRCGQMQGRRSGIGWRLVYYSAENSKLVAVHMRPIFISESESWALSFLLYYIYIFNLLTLGYWHPKDSVIFKTWQRKMAWPTTYALKL